MVYKHAIYNIGALIEQTNKASPYEAGNVYCKGCEKFYMDTGLIFCVVCSTKLRHRARGSKKKRRYNN